MVLASKANAMKEYLAKRSTRNEYDRDCKL